MGTELPPPRAQRSEIYSRRCSNPPSPRKAKTTMNGRAPVVCLVTVPVSCLDTAAMPGEKPPPDPSLRAPVVCLATVPVSSLETAAGLVLGHSSRAEGRNPPGPPPRARPLVLGHSFCLVLGHRSRAGGSTCLVLGRSSRSGGGRPPPDPPSSTPSRAGTHLYLLIIKKQKWVYKHLHGMYRTCSADYWD